MKQTYVRTAALVALLFTGSTFASLYEVDSPEISDQIELKTGIYYRNAATSDVLVVPGVELQAPVARDLEIEVDGGYGNEVQANGRHPRVSRATVALPTPGGSVVEPRCGAQVESDRTARVSRSRGQDREVLGTRGGIRAHQVVVVTAL
jgi:hypothetical protein